MRVEILGSCGAGTTPRPLCECAVCAEARAKGIPYARRGPSIFVHGPDLLFESIGAGWRTWPPEARRVKTTRVYLPEQVTADFRRLDVVEQLRAKRVVLSHIEEMDGLSHDQWLDVARKHEVEIAYDGLVLEV